MMDAAPYLNAYSFRVQERVVGSNPSDPLGMRRAQRLVFDLVVGIPTDGPPPTMHHANRLLAHHAPTGGGKTHLLRQIVAANGTLPHPRKLVFAFPTQSLVRQQVGLLDAIVIDPEATFQEMRQAAILDPHGNEAAEYARYKTTCQLPRRMRGSALVGAALASTRPAPLAMTPDALDLAIRGVVSGAMAFHGKAGTVTPKQASVAIRAMLRHFLDSRLAASAAGKVESGVVSAVSPTRMGRNLRGKLMKLIRGGFAKANHPMPEGTTNEDIWGIVDRIVASATPVGGDTAPGPKYSFPPDIAGAIEDRMRDAIVVFDEYHECARYAANFRRLVARIRRLGATVLFLSGTPRTDFMDQAGGREGWLAVNFDEVEDASLLPPGEPLSVFNQPLEVQIRRARFRSDYDPYADVIAQVDEWDAKAPGPSVLIFESKVRALALKGDLMGLERFQGRVMWWTGPEKAPRLADVLAGKSELPHDAVVIGTSAIEMGVDLPFRNCWTECRHHESLMQRIGRIGRQGSPYVGQLHHVVILVEGALPDPSLILHGPGGEPLGPIRRNELDRTLRALLNLPDHRPDLMRESLWFRGERHAQCLVAVPNGLALDGSGRMAWKTVRGLAEEMLRLYPCHRVVADDWAFLSQIEKRDALRDAGIADGESLMRAVREEDLVPTKVAYVAQGMSVSSMKAVAEVVTTSPSGRRCVVRWMKGSHEVMRATIPASALQHVNRKNVPPPAPPVDPRSSSVGDGIQPQAKRGIRMLGHPHAGIRV